jgi:hypothetical protein
VACDRSVLSVSDCYERGESDSAQALFAAGWAVAGCSVRRRRYVLGRIRIRGNEAIVQFGTYVLSGGTDRSPGVIHAPSRPQAELAYTALGSCYRAIDSNACALQRAGLASLLTGRQANQCENNPKRCCSTTYHVASPHSVSEHGNTAVTPARQIAAKNVDFGINCETVLRSVACQLPCCAASSNREP